MDMNDVPSSVGISDSEVENNSVKNMEISHSVDQENELEAEKPVQSEQECDNNSLKEKKDLQLKVDLEFTETVVKSEEGVRETVHAAETVGVSLKDQSPNGSVEIGRRGVKRARVTVDDDGHQPSVHVIYKSLTRASKKKLEELLQQWSHWHAKHVSSSNDLSEVLESSEKTFFPAVCVGHESTSSVSFWMENQTMNGINTDVSPIDDNSVPLYDRGYALGLNSADGSSNADGGLEIIDVPSRCFNCGSYSHALRECPRPRDYTAVSNARNKLKSRRNQNSSRNPTRYYQNSPAGKYDGLRPGALDDTTRQLLGLGEFDPPPWLNRMRELGYPPGYLDVDEEDQPSGITIFTDKDVAEQEDGEIVGADSSKPKLKMSVEFPGINAPIPGKADERLWAARDLVPSISSDISRNWSQQRSASFGSRGHHREQRIGDLRDDGPPGDPGLGSSQFTFQPRFGSGHVSPNSMAEWSSRRNPLHEEESPKPFSFHSQYYSTPERHFSPLERDSGSSRHGNRSSGSMHDRDRDRDFSSRFNDRRPEDRHYHSRR